MAARATALASGPIGQAVLEVLDSLMARETRELVLAQALEHAGRMQIPESTLAVRQLAKGPLRRAVIEHVGLDAAQSMLQELDPILAVVESGVRRREVTTRPHTFLPRAGEQTFPPATPRARALVVVTLASLEPLKGSLGPTARVGRVRDAFELLTAIETRDGDLSIVVDGFNRVADVESLVTFLPRLPEGVRVLLWGFHPDETFVIRGEPGWEVLDEGPSWHALADVLRGR